VSTSYKKQGERPDELLIEIQEPAKTLPKLSSKATNPIEALEILRNEPDYESLVATLNYLIHDSNFSLKSPSPLTAQLVHILVSETIPTYWGVIRNSQKVRRNPGAKKISDSQLLLSCLRNIAGLNAVLLSIKQYIQKSRETKKDIGSSNINDILTSLLQVLSNLLVGDSSVEEVSDGIWNAPDNSLRKKTMWNEFLGVIGGGKIIGLSAEAEDVLNSLDKKFGEKFWIADGALYTKWLARNISRWAQALQHDNKQGWKLCTELLSRSFSLGHTGMDLFELLENKRANSI